MDMMRFDITSEPTIRALSKFFADLEAKDKENLFTPGHRFVLECGNDKIMYVALDPRQKPPENGIFQPWISVDDELPPPTRCEQYLVRVRSGGPPYGGWEYAVDFAWWGECWQNGSYGYDWTTICNDWDGEVTITHWMKIPDPPEEE